MKLEVVKIRLTLAFPNEETREQKARGKERGFHRVSVDVSCDTLVEMFTHLPACCQRLRV